VYNVCSGTETSLLEVAQIAQEAAPGLPPFKFGPRRPADILRSVGDPMRARDVLGFSASDDRAALRRFLAIPNND
jgi:nucleoside-diphosphate-sugar epimerase